MRRARAVALALALAVAALGATGAAGAATPQTNLPDIEDEVMCTICGTTLQLSESPQAERERAFINKLIAEGKTKDEIKDELVAEYGPEVLAVPSSGGFDLAAGWILPIAGVLLGGIAVALAARRWRRRPATAPAAGANAGIDPGEARRLEDDLDRYGR